MGDQNGKTEPDPELVRAGNLMSQWRKKAPRVIALIIIGVVLMLGGGSISTIATMIYDKGDLSADEARWMRVWGFGLMGLGAALALIPNFARLMADPVQRIIIGVVLLGFLGYFIYMVTEWIDHWGPYTTVEQMTRLMPCAGFGLGTVIAWLSGAVAQGYNFGCLESRSDKNAPGR